MANAAELIAQRLYRAGVRQAFGIPGGEVLTIIKALDEQGIEFVMCKHENAAGFMAEGTYHASGSPAVLVATVGPGVANAVNFIANAQQDRVPVIYLTGRVDRVEAVTYTHQVFDHAAVLNPLCKATLEVTDGAVEEMIDKAVNIALDFPPGPVHVDVPISVAATQQPSRKINNRAIVNMGIASGKEFEVAKQLLADASRPLVIAGVEVLYQRAEVAVANFCNAFAIPLITSYKAKGILSENHAMSVAGAGLSPKANKIILPLVKQADVIILAGYDPVEMRSDWRNVWSNSTRVIELSSQPNTHYMHQSDVSFVCDIGASLNALGSLRKKQQPAWVNDEIQTTRQALAIAFQSEPDWGPAKLIHMARDMMPAETIATADTGAHRILLSQIWSCYSPRSLIQSSGLCTMGCALPLAIGFKRIKPELPVIAFTGDAGLEMVLGDLATLRDSHLPVIIVVFVDASLALIELKQRVMQYDNVGVDSIGYTDFVKVAEGFDLAAAWVDDAESFKLHLQSALKNKLSTLLACRIGRRAYDDKI